MLFFLLIHVEMPTFNIYEKEKFHAQLSCMKKFCITSGPEAQEQSDQGLHVCSYLSISILRNFTTC